MKKKPHLKQEEQKTTDRPRHGKASGGDSSRVRKGDAAQKAKGKAEGRK